MSQQTISNQLRKFLKVILSYFGKKQPESRPTMSLHTQLRILRDQELGLMRADHGNLTAEESEALGTARGVVYRQLTQVEYEILVNEFTEWENYVIEQCEELLNFSSSDAGNTDLKILKQYFKGYENAGADIKESGKNFGRYRTQYKEEIEKICARVDELIVFTKELLEEITERVKKAGVEKALRSVSQVRMIEQERPELEDSALPFSRHRLNELKARPAISDSMTFEIERVKSLDELTS